MVVLLPKSGMLTSATQPGLMGAVRASKSADGHAGFGGVVGAVGMQRLQRRLRYLGGMVAVGGTYCVCRAFVGPGTVPKLKDSDALAAKPLNRQQQAHGAEEPTIQSRSIHDEKPQGADSLTSRLSNLLVATVFASAASRRSGRRVVQKASTSSATMDTSIGNLEDKASTTGAGESSEVSEWLPRAALLTMAMFCSTNFTFLKLLEEHHHESVVACVRFIVALLPFLPLIPQHTNRSSIISGVEIGLWCTLGYVTQAIGLQSTEASTGAFLCSLAMVVVPVVQFFKGSKVQLQTWIAVALAATGTALLVGVGGAAGAGTGPSIGELLCTLTAVGFGFMFVRMDDYAKEPDFDTLGCTIWQVITLAVTMTAWAAISCGPTAAFHEATQLLSSGPEMLMPLLWVGIVTTAGVLYIETWCMEKMDGAEAGVIFASEPVWATLFASQMLGERFGLMEGMGSALILTACVLTQIGPGKESPEKNSVPQEAIKAAP